MIPILSGNVASALPSGYEVDNSCRFNDGDSSDLERSASNLNQQTFTISFWTKLGVSATGNVLAFYSGGDYFRLFFENGQFKMKSVVSASTVTQVKTTAVFRDFSAWYNFVIRVDTTQGTASNRIRFYVNGSEITSLAESDYPSENLNIVTRHNLYIGQSGGDDNFFDGYLCEFVFLDGVSTDATSFGEFDADTPTIWKPKDVSGLTFGTYGFYLDFKDSSNLGNDANGGTDFTETNLDATDQATDTCTNNFCTANPLDQNGSYTLSQGNCQLSSGHTSWFNIGSTIAVANGKWYWEVEFDAGTMIEIMVGIHDTSVNRTDTNSWVTGSTLFYNDSGGEIRTDGTDSTANYGTLSAGDILGIALNMDDKQITLLKNGSAIASNVAISTSITEAIPTFLTDANNVVFKVNFGGSPSFTVSSGNADGEGYGNFEFAPPSGYFSLCTKNLAEYG